jgi:hypothetical protein
LAAEHDVWFLVTLELEPYKKSLECNTLFL